MLISSNKLPDYHTTAIAVCDIIDSCKTNIQLRGAWRCINNYEKMFPQWAWVYMDEFFEALSDKQNQLPLD